MRWHEPTHETFEHAADIGVRGFGPTREAAFEQAALAMTSVITDLDRVEQHEAIEIECEADDDELLFVKWLNALVYEMATRGMLFSRFLVRLEPGRIRSRAWGESVDRARHQPAVEVKGATVTELCVQQDPDDRWRAQCVVDV